MSVATREATIGCEGALALVGVACADRAEARRERGAAIVVSNLSELLEAP